jgi:hypothetical protein
MPALSGSPLLEIMDVELKHAAKNTEYTLFVIQQPNDPFGISWYQGDIATDPYPSRNT